MLLVVTPTLGASPYLSDTLKSISEHCGGNCRHVLVTPRSHLLRLSESYPAQQIMAENDEYGGGLYGAVNTALATIDGWDEFTYINDDDCIGPGIRQARQLLKADRNADIVYGEVALIWKRRLLNYGLTVCRSPRLLPLVWASRHPGLYQQGTVVRKRVVDELGGFAPRFTLTADGHFWQAAAARNFCFAYVRATTGVFRMRAGQLSENQDAMRMESQRHREGLAQESRRSRKLVGDLIWRFYGIGHISRRLMAGGRLRMAQMVGTDPADETQRD